MSTDELYLILTGQTEDHLVDVPGVPRKIHKEALTPYLNLKKKAEEAGFDLYLSSSFRSYDQQSRIWNPKAKGERILLDHRGIPMLYKNLSPDEIVTAILKWSALPGASRHHWGTDIDIYDKNGLPDPDYDPQLTPQEVADDGMFGPLHIWLDERMKRDEAEGFFRPYQKDLGGVNPERWHLSYGPVSHEYLKSYTTEILDKLIEKLDVEFSDIVVKRKDEIFKQYIHNISS